LKAFVPINSKKRTASNLEEKLKFLINITTLCDKVCQGLATGQ
jgi:hypothetical protein